VAFRWPGLAGHHEEKLLLLLCLPRIGFQFAFAFLQDAWLICSAKKKKNQKKTKKKKKPTTLYKPNTGKDLTKGIQPPTGHDDSNRGFS
jgi:hypothetical protein